MSMSIAGTSLQSLFGNQFSRFPQPFQPDAQSPQKDRVPEVRSDTQADARGTNTTRPEPPAKRQISIAAENAEARAMFQAMVEAERKKDADAIARAEAASEAVAEADRLADEALVAENSLMYLNKISDSIENIVLAPDLTVFQEGQAALKSSVVIVPVGSAESEAGPLTSLLESVTKALAKIENGTSGVLKLDVIEKYQASIREMSPHV